MPTLRRWNDKCNSKIPNHANRQPLPRRQPPTAVPRHVLAMLDRIAHCPVFFKWRRTPVRRYAIVTRKDFGSHPAANPAQKTAVSFA
jgi:hypothetical protein